MKEVTGSRTTIWGANVHDPRAIPPEAESKMVFEISHKSIMTLLGRAFRVLSIDIDPEGYARIDVVEVEDD